MTAKRPARFWLELLADQDNQCAVVALIAPTSSIGRTEPYNQGSARKDHDPTGDDE